MLDTEIFVIVVSKGWYKLKEETVKGDEVSTCHTSFDSFT